MTLTFELYRDDWEYNLYSITRYTNEDKGIYGITPEEARGLLRSIAKELGYKIIKKTGKTRVIYEK